jgi:hypothetical protein
VLPTQHSSCSRLIAITIDDVGRKSTERIRAIGVCL